MVAALCYRRRVADPIIAREALAVVDEALRQRIRASGEPTLNVDDPSFGEALTRALLFERHPDLVERVAPGLSPRDRFYNRYYWVQRFATQYLATRGFDAGIEQWVFKLVESADALEVDWALLEALDRRARGD